MYLIIVASFLILLTFGSCRGQIYNPQRVEQNSRVTQLFYNVTNQFLCNERYVNANPLTSETISEIRLENLDDCLILCGRNTNCGVMVFEEETNLCSIAANITGCASDDVLLFSKAETLTNILNEPFETTRGIYQTTAAAGHTTVHNTGQTLNLPATSEYQSASINVQTTEAVQLVDEIGESIVTYAPDGVTVDQASSDGITDDAGISVANGRTTSVDFGQRTTVELIRDTTLQYQGETTIGINSQTTTDYCDVMTCSNGGTLVSSGSMCSCQCTLGFGGETCETNYCIEVTCSNGGTQVPTANGCDCQCVIGFGGNTCETDYCASVLCENSGTEAPTASGCDCQCLTGFTGVHCETDNGHELVESPLTVDNGFPLGEWGLLDTCPTGSFASGVRLKVGEGWDDNFGITYVSLTCAHAVSLTEVGDITSFGLEGSDWGSWMTPAYCPENYFIVQFQLEVEPRQYIWDDSSAVNIRVSCRGPGSDGIFRQTLEPEGDDGSGAEWGRWSGTCETGMAVAGIQTKYMDDQGFEDDMAIGDVKLYCAPISI